MQLFRCFFEKKTQDKAPDKKVLKYWSSVITEFLLTKKYYVMKDSIKHI